MKTTAGFNSNGYPHSPENWFVKTKETEIPPPNEQGAQNIIIVTP